MSQLSSDSTKPTKKRKLLGEMREWTLKKSIMPQIIMQVNRTQKPRYNKYLSNEFSKKDFIETDKEFALIGTSKYPEFVFLRSSNPHNLCLHLWADPILNRYIHQTYLIQYVTKDINFIATHPLLFGDNKIFKLFGDKKCIQLLGPLIPKSICLSPSEKKCTHVLNIIKAYHKYYFGIFDKKYCFGTHSTNVKLDIKKFNNASISISRAYYKLREIFWRETYFFGHLSTDFIALDIGSSPGGWTKYFVDKGAKTVFSVDPGELKLDDVTMKNVKYFQKTIEKCIDDADLIIDNDWNNKFDIIVCDANMLPMNAVKIINDLCWYLKDNGFIIFTMKMPDRSASGRCQRIGNVQDELGNMFENMKLIHLFANKGKERTLIATKIKMVMENVYEFHEMHSF